MVCARPAAGRGRCRSRAVRRPPPTADKASDYLYYSIVRYPRDIEISWLPRNRSIRGANAMRSAVDLGREVSYHIAPVSRGGVVVVGGCFQPTRYSAQSANVAVARTTHATTHNNTGSSCTYFRRHPRGGEWSRRE